MLYRILLTLGLIFTSSSSAPAINSYARVTIIVESLPVNTPREDSIFVCGNFNNWNINDKSYLLQRRSNGKLAASIPMVKDTIEFKFSRGDWMNIETEADNSHRPNRRLFGEFETPVIVSIENWQDTGGQTPFPLYILVLSAAVLNGLFLIFIVIRLKSKDKIRTAITIKWTLFLISVISGAIVYEFSDLVWKYWFLLTFPVLLFISGPLLLHLFRAFFFNERRPLKIHFIPAVMACIVNIPRFTDRWFPDSMNSIINHNTFLIDFILIMAGLITLLGYLLYILNQILEFRKYIFHNCNTDIIFNTNHSQTDAAINSGTVKSSQRPNNLTEHKGGVHDNFSSSPFENLAFKKSSSTFITGKTFCIQKPFSEWFLVLYLSIINLFAVLSGTFFYLLYTLGVSIIPNYYDLVLSIASVQLFVIFYFAFFKESVFLKGKLSSRSSLNNDLAIQIKDLMNTSKPYKNPDLSLSAFSEMLNAKPHVVSKTINDCFNRNYRDFINEYRVSEFIKMVYSKDTKDLTYLYLAHEVGFNSKSTFNLAFKKATGFSPSEYFKKNAQISD